MESQETDIPPPGARYTYFIVSGRQTSENCPILSRDGKLIGKSGENKFSHAQIGFQLNLLAENCPVILFLYTYIDTTCRNNVLT